MSDSDKFIPWFNAENAQLVSHGHRKNNLKLDVGVDGKVDAARLREITAGIREAVLAQPTHNWGGSALYAHPWQGPEWNPKSDVVSFAAFTPFRHEQVLRVLEPWLRSIEAGLKKPGETWFLVWLFSEPLYDDTD